jgi:hypothetical protein
MKKNTFYTLLQHPTTHRGILAFAAMFLITLNSSFVTLTVDIHAWGYWLLLSVFFFGVLTMLTKRRFQQTIAKTPLWLVLLVAATAIVSIGLRFWYLDVFSKVAWGLSALLLIVSLYSQSTPTQKVKEGAPKRPIQ